MVPVAFHFLSNFRSSGQRRCLLWFGFRLLVGFGWWFVVQSHPFGFFNLYHSRIMHDDFHSAVMQRPNLPANHFQPVQWLIGAALRFNLNRVHINKTSCQFDGFNSDTLGRHYGEIKTAAPHATTFRQRRQLKAIFSISFFIQLTTYIVVIIHERPELSTVFLIFF
jgi:hypothetical protein